MPFTLAFRMQMAAANSSSEEEIIITFSGAGGSQSFSAPSWTEESSDTTNAERVYTTWGTKADGSGGVHVRVGASGGVNYFEWSDNDGVNWNLANGNYTSRTNVNGARGLAGRTDSNTNGKRWVAHANSLGYEAVYYSNDGKVWNYDNRSSYTSNYRCPRYCYWEDDNERWVGIGNKRNLYVSNSNGTANTGTGNWGRYYQDFGWNAVGSGSDSTPQFVYGHKVNGSNHRKVVMSNESESLWYIDSNDLSGNNQTTATQHGDASGGNGDYDWGDYGKIDDPTNPGTIVDGWIMGGGTASNLSKGRINASKDGENWYHLHNSNSPDGVREIHYWEDHDVWTLYDNSNSQLKASMDGGLSWDAMSVPGGGIQPHDRSYVEKNGDMVFGGNRGGNSGTNYIYSSPGPVASGSNASLDITGDESAHSGITQTVTFDAGISAADATTQVKALFSGGTIPNYTVTDINSTSFKIVSDETGDETDIAFAITTGTGGNLASTVTIEDGS